MAESTNDATAVPPSTGDPGRPRYLGLWVAGILMIALFGGAMGVVTDVIYRLLLGK